MSESHAGKVVRDYLQVFGIDPEATDIYLELASQGPCSALQLAKQTGISRTQVYRRLEELQANGLVGTEALSYGTLFLSLPLENVEDMIVQREVENKAARDDLSDMVELLQKMAGSAGPKATVQHFYGVAGIKQANWNLTRADNKYQIFEAAHNAEHFDKKYSRRLRERCTELGLTGYRLTNNTTATARDLEPFDPQKTFVRHIDPAIMPIRFEVLLYNDVVALLDHSQAQRMAIEIHHPTFHVLMRQLFDALWHVGTPLKIT